MIKVNIALIGCGRWGKNIARALDKTGTLKLIVDADIVGVSAFAKDMDAKVSNDLHLAFDASIDAVAIAVPAIQHFNLCKQALEAGKHVFVEKPLALDVEEAIKLADLAKRKGLTLMVGHLLQYHPAFIKLCEVVHTGEIGEIRHVSSNRINAGAIRTEENVLWSFAPHDFSMINKIVGQAPKTVEAIAVRVVNPAIPDQFLVQLRFTEHLTANINVSWLGPIKEHKLVVLGTKGAIVFEDTAATPDRKLVLYSNYVDNSGTAPVYVKTDGVPVSYQSEEPLLQEMKYFIDCVSGNAAPRTGSDEAIPVLKLLYAASNAAGIQV